MNWKEDTFLTWGCLYQLRPYLESVASNYLGEMSKPRNLAKIKSAKTRVNKKYFLFTHFFANVFSRIFNFKANYYTNSRPLISKVALVLLYLVYVKS